MFRDGGDVITGIRLQDTRTGEETDLEVGGLFVAIGHTPMSDVFKGQLAMDDEGYLLVKPNSTATDIPGVFAAGDVSDREYRQAITAAGMGCAAAISAERWLAGLE